MKKQLFYLTAVLFIAVSSCKKDVKIISSQTLNGQQPNQPPEEVKAVILKQLATELLSLSKNKNFTDIVFNE